jgi:hypothetical protein
VTVILYRTGAHWRVTVVKTETLEEPDAEGRRPGDQLVCMARTPEDAELIVKALNKFVIPVTDGR